MDSPDKTITGEISAEQKQTLEEKLNEKKEAAEAAAANKVVKKVKGIPFKWPTWSGKYKKFTRAFVKIPESQRYVIWLSLGRFMGYITEEQVRQTGAEIPEAPVEAQEEPPVESEGCLVQEPDPS